MGQTGAVLPLVTWGGGGVQSCCGRASALDVWLGTYRCGAVCGMLQEARFRGLHASTQTHRDVADITQHRLEDCQ